MAANPERREEPARLDAEIARLEAELARIDGTSGARPEPGKRRVREWPPFTSGVVIATFLVTGAVAAVGAAMAFWNLLFPPPCYGFLCFGPTLHLGIFTLMGGAAALLIGSGVSILRRRPIGRTGGVLILGSATVYFLWLGVEAVIYLLDPYASPENLPFLPAGILTGLLAWRLHRADREWFLPGPPRDSTE